MCAGPAFKSVVAALPASSKTRLQVRKICCAALTFPAPVMLAAPLVHPEPHARTNHHAGETHSHPPTLVCLQSALQQQSADLSYPAGAVGSSAGKSTEVKAKPGIQLKATFGSHR